MGFTYDIYGLTTERTPNVIDLFLDIYTDRNKEENRNDEELMILDQENSDDQNENYKWRKSPNLTEHIAYGIDNPNECFTFYVDSKYIEIDQAIISFTTDGNLILGLSVDAGFESEVPISKPISILQDLKSHISFVHDLIMFEEPPPSDKSKFLQLCTESDLRKNAP